MKLPKYYSFKYASDESYFESDESYFESDES